MVANKLAGLLQATARVQILEPLKVTEKIRRLTEGGFDELQFIVDFDYTMTRAHKSGLPVDCSWGVLEHYKELSPEYLRKTAALKAKFHPIELDHKMSVEEKIPHMVEWYTQVNHALTEEGVHRDWYQHMIENSSCEFRDGTDELMTRLERDGVPVLILSAGLGDLIKEILKYFKLLHSNMTIVSNFCEYDETGLIVGLKKPMIHMFNKSESAIHDPKFERRKNIVLMGDSLGDLHMADGIPNPNVILKIGFLNRNVEENLVKYKEHFDVVLIDDQTMDFPLAVLEEMEAKLSEKLLLDGKLAE